MSCHVKKGVGEVWHGDSHGHEILTMKLHLIFALALALALSTWAVPMMASKLRKALGIASISLSFGLAPTICHANVREVGDIETTGFFLKDKLKVSAFTDPKVTGVTLFLSDFDRPALEKLNNVFDDPSSASISCVKSGPISIQGIDTSKSGEEIFEESKNLIFKQIRVRRLFDKQSNSLIYVSYNTRLNKGDDTNKSRFKSSMCAVNLYEPTAVAATSTVTTPKP